MQILGVGTTDESVLPMTFRCVTRAFADCFETLEGCDFGRGKLQDIAYLQKPVLYWSCGPSARGTFCLVGKDDIGPELFVGMAGRGAAYGGIDNDDGDLDMLVASNKGPGFLFKNEAIAGNGFLRVKSVGKKSNRSGIGAKGRIRTGESVRRREVTSDRSFASQSELPVTFGLGKRALVDEFKVRWPPGPKEMSDQVRGNRTVVILEGQGGAL